ncbi:MAG: type I-E CRISPR-associated protein Cse1/CasA [Desulfonatronovibrio sp.]
MNLLEDFWLPFRTRTNEIRYLSPLHVQDVDLVDLALPRADFQGAGWQFLIGLLQTFFPPEDLEEWQERWEKPPDVQELSRFFTLGRDAFNLLGQRPLFMQDFDHLDEARSSSVSSLLIEAPGGNTLRLNTDHFIKRGQVEVVCPSCAAMALYTMQINAPSGGKGYRVGLRGGGPLTTLVLPQDPQASLWQKLWLNVLDRSNWTYDRPALNSSVVFPWMGPTRVSEKPGTKTFPEDVHPLHIFWAMPRRFRLEAKDSPCKCDICGHTSSRSIRQIRTKNYGYNYEGPWRHPLTPYRRNPKQPDQPPISIKGQQGGIGYQHWEALALGNEEKHGNMPALVVLDFANKAKALRDFGPTARQALLWAFGYDMENMKARGWYSTQMPLLAIPAEWRDLMLDWVTQMTDAARSAAWNVRNKIKHAWFTRPDDLKEKEYKAKAHFIELRFWERTEADFYDCLFQLYHSLEQNQDDLFPAEIARRWYFNVRDAALGIFDELALSGEAESLDMKRVTTARNQLLGWLVRDKHMARFRRLAQIDVPEKTEATSFSATA